jgi:hypothetical protein
MQPSLARANQAKPTRASWWQIAKMIGLSSWAVFSFLVLFQA